ncbi:SLAP domain-containing protein, partial [Lactobacillus sp. ESL0245]
MQVKEKEDRSTASAQPAQKAPRAIKAQRVRTDTNAQTGSLSAQPVNQLTVTDDQPTETTKSQIPTNKDPRGKQMTGPSQDHNGTKPLTPTDQDQNNKSGINAQDDNGGKISEVTNWKDYLVALSDSTVTEIDIMNDFAAPDGYNLIPIASSNSRPRDLFITSKGGKHKVDYKGTSLTCTSKINITYDNLELWCANYYGVIDTDNTPVATVTFKDIDFHGSQMAHATSHTHYHFKGTNNAETVRMPYPGTTVILANNQQLLELMNSDNSIDFDDGTFTGSTYNGTVIELGSRYSLSSYNKVNIAAGAKVVLNPGKNADNLVTAGSAEYTGAQYGIYMYGSNLNVNVNGTLQINVGQAGFKQTTADNRQASGIYISKGSNNFNIKTGGQVEVQTNGDISTINTDSNSGNLIYNGGNFKIDPKGSLKVTGTNMRKYSGTLFMIKGSADVNNGTFEIKLDGDANDDGAGTGVITLVDIQGTLNVNNPQSLILNAQNNKAVGTTIIGQNTITLSNVSQVLRISNQELNLPPFAKLQLNRGKVTDKGTIIGVSALNLLNGQRKITSELLSSITDTKYKALINLLVSKGLIGANMTFDDAFKNIIIAAFGDKTFFSDGYNNIHFKSANPDGFLDIENVSVTTGANGSRIIKGHITNYNDKNEGPDSDGIFSKILPGGTYAYVGAKFESANSLLNDKNYIGTIKNPNPYGETNVIEAQNEFAAQVDGNGYFEFEIPADKVNQLKPGDKIELVPYANFISYDPENKDDHSYDLQILSVDEQKSAAHQAIKEEAATTKQKIQEDQSLTAEEKTQQTKAVDAAAQAADDQINKATNADEVNTAVKDGKAAIDQAHQAGTGVDEQKSQAKAEIDQAAKNAKDKVDSNKDITDKQKAKDQIDKIAQDAKDKIDNAQDQAIINSSKNQGIADINKIADGKDNKDDQAEAKEKAKDAVDEAANDAKDKVDSNKDITDKQKAKDQIDKIAQDAKDKIDNAQDQAIINSSKNQGIADINKIADGKDNKDDQAEVKEKAKDAVDEAAKDAKDKVDSNKDITDKQKAKDQIDKIAQDAKDKIDNAQDQAIINSSKNQGIADINKVAEGKDNNGNSNNIPLPNAGNGNSSSNSNPGDSKVPEPSPKPTPNAVEKTLKHNAYFYNKEGKRANLLIAKKGSIIATYGTEKINGHDFYLTDNGLYVDIY